MINRLLQDYFQSEKGNFTAMTTMKIYMKIWSGKQ